MPLRQVKVLNAKVLPYCIKVFLRAFTDAAERVGNKIVQEQMPQLVEKRRPVSIFEQCDDALAVGSDLDAAADLLLIAPVLKVRQRILGHVVRAERRIVVAMRRCFW